MEPDWIKKCTLRAHLDKIRFVIEAEATVTRAMVAENLPKLEIRGHSRSGVPGPRWELRHVDPERNCFVVTVHDPSSIQMIVAVVDRMARRIPLLRDPTIQLLELAVDVIPKSPGTLDLERVAADLFKGAKFEPSENTRAANKDGAVGLGGPDAAYRNLKAGRSVYNGSVGDDAMVRCYVKRKDNKVRLSEDQHCARFEVELMGKGLPVEILRDLDGYRFERLSEMFLMSRPADDLPPLIELLAARAPKLRRMPRRGRRARLFMDAAFASFNKRAHAALVGLSERLASRRGCPYRPDHLACINGESVSSDRFFQADQPDRANTGRPARTAPLTTTPIGVVAIPDSDRMSA